RVDFGILRGRFLLLAPEARALAAGARLAAAAHLAALLVLGTLLEASLRQVSIDLGAARVRPRAHEINCGFLAALEGADDFVDHAIIDQGLQGGGCLHESLRAYWGTARSARRLMGNPGTPPAITRAQ